MKKIIYFLISVIFILPSCSSNNEAPDSSPAKPSAAELEIADLLDGKFIGSVYSASTNTTETEELSFYPYASLENKFVWDLVGTSIHSREVWIFGKALYVKYFNDHLLQISRDCYYSVSIPYSGASPILELYPYGEDGEVNNRTESFYLSSVSASSFVMRPVGTGEDLNKVMRKEGIVPTR